MRKLRTALVATMVGGASMIGAGVANAGVWQPPDPSFQCNSNQLGDTNTGTLGLPTALTSLTLGPDNRVFIVCSPGATAS